MKEGAFFAFATAIGREKGVTAGASVSMLPVLMSGELTYKDSGVDTRRAAAFVGEIGAHVKRTQQQRQLFGLLGFLRLFMI